MPIIIYTKPASSSIGTGYHPLSPPSLFALGTSLMLLSHSYSCFTCLGHHLSSCSNPTTSPTIVHEFQALFMIFPASMTISIPHPSAFWESQFAALLFSVLLLLSAVGSFSITIFCLWIIAFSCSNYLRLLIFFRTVWLNHLFLRCICFLTAETSVPVEAAHFTIQLSYPPITISFSLSFGFLMPVLL